MKVPLIPKSTPLARNFAAARTAKENPAKFEIDRFSFDFSDVGKRDVRIEVESSDIPERLHEELQWRGLKRTDYTLTPDVLPWPNKYTVVVKQGIEFQPRNDKLPVKQD